MALTIGPAVCPAKTVRRLSQGTFFLGTFFGALATYGVLRGALVDEFHLARPERLAAIAVAAGLVTLRDSGIPVPTPYLHKQVPEWFRGLFPLPVTSAAFGFQLGLGFATKYTYGAHLALMLVLATTVPPSTAVSALVVYALLRAASTSVGAAEESVGALARSLQVHRTQERWLRASSIALTIGLAATAFAPSAF